VIGELGAEVRQPPVAQLDPGAGAEDAAPAGATPALGGFAIELFAIAWDQSLQAHVPRDALSRVYSYDMVGSFIAVPLGEVAVGPLAHTSGTVPVLLGCAAIIVVVTAAAACSRSVWRIRAT